MHHDEESPLRIRMCYLLAMRDGLGFVEEYEIARPATS